jgi:type I restriction-modification system DNA methylase subunit
VSIVADFVNKVIAIRNTGNATEHSYRSAIESLFAALDPLVRALNEPKRIECGAPDFIVQRGELVVGHVEAKDIGIGIRNMKDPNNKYQQERYRKALPNLIYTNCLDWDFYRDGQLVESITIADFILGIQPNPNCYEQFTRYLVEFISQQPQSITSPIDLAERMAGKASLIKEVLYRTLVADELAESELTVQYRTFKEHLIHDIEKEEFADIYAETMAYGMFAARLHDTTQSTFDRQEALTLLPKSNPFLRNLFTYIAGADLDDRIAWIIDDLATVFEAVDTAKIMRGFGGFTGRKDPFLHFYETFLAAYNPKKRKAKGVWYTPEPVVHFIVRAIDEVLQNEYQLSEGLADDSKIDIDWDTGQFDKKGRPISTKKSVHKVQILDPATGTGTFLAEVIKNIAPKVKSVAPGGWSSYIESELIPRLHGFEILMASYAMCHMKIDMILTELGYQPSSTAPRLSVFLTNSLEEGEAANMTLPFAQWLSNEVKFANTIKRDMPIMCVIGNPPYLGEGGKPTGWMGNLLDDYKKEPGGQVKLRERNSKWLNDLYVKFMRMSSHLIEKNNEGVLGFITNHGYLDNPTFRGMRWHLLKTFDKIWILDLNGSAKKKLNSLSNVPDKNVFDIMQGVSIIIAVKLRGEKSHELAKVYHSELWGSRAAKYQILSTESIYGELFKPLEYKPPQYALARQDLSEIGAYNQGFLLSEFMPLHGNGIVTKRDSLNIHNSRAGVEAVAHNIATLSESEFRTKYKLKADVRDWRYEWARQDVLDCYPAIPVEKIGYRIFDTRYIFYSGRSRGLVGWPVPQIMENYIDKDNVGLLVSKAHRDASFAHAFVTDKPTEAIHFSATTGSNAINFPLYIYPPTGSIDSGRVTNFEKELFKKIRILATNDTYGMPNELDVFDYIYAVLYSPSYRKTYSDLLKVDYPRIPWPEDANYFWALSSEGTKLRELHLLKENAFTNVNYPLLGPGENLVKFVKFENGKLMINEQQWFDGAPACINEFYIGGYKPPFKWLKDRQGTALSFSDVKHVQKIIEVVGISVAIMHKIDAIMKLPS